MHTEVSHCWFVSHHIQSSTVFVFGMTQAASKAVTTITQAESAVRSAGSCVIAELGSRRHFPITLSCGAPEAKILLSIGVQHLLADLGERYSLRQRSRVPAI
jgi:hypothetical protein